MDNINFQKNYYLPLLIELKSSLNNKSINDLIKSFILFFSKSISYTGNGNNGNKGELDLMLSHLEINRSVFRGIYIHIDFTQKLFHILNVDTINNHQFHDFIKNKITPNRQMIAITGPVLSKIIEISGSKILPLAKDYYSFLENKIEETNNNIDSSYQNDRAIVDMI